MSQQNQKKNLPAILWSVSGFLLLALLFARAIYPEYLWMSAVIALLLVVSLGALIQQNQKALKSRTVAYGVNSVVTVILVISIVGVLNFLASRYPQKWDLTKNKVHTLSDQTKKLVKSLSKPVKATFFAKLQQREQNQALFDNYKGLNPKFELEYVDPDREPARAKAAGIKKYGTLLLAVGNRENKIEEITEEKLTNALIKLLKEKSPTLCALTGHGEKNFSGNDVDGYESAKKALGDQSYEVRDLNLMQETKIPETCDAITILGPTKGFFPAEIGLLKAYLENGGRAVIGTDINIKGGEYAPELLALLQEWHVKADRAVVVDPFSRMLGVDASVAILATFSKENPLTKDFQSNCAFPFARPLEVIPGAPAGMNVQWLAQTTPKSWAVMDLQGISKGEVKLDQARDKAGPLTVAIAVEGKQKDSKATKNTRLVVFGSSSFANNNYARYAGNLDFFLNAISYVMEDESLISIRAKEDGPGKVELSQKSGTFIFLFTVVVIPLLVAVAGLVIWIFRRRL